jgi:hypothetical protein
MNAFNKETGSRIAGPANRQTGIPVGGGAPRHDLQTLAGNAKMQAALMEENRTKINKGWEELKRLDRQLEVLDARIRLNEINLQSVRSPVSHSTGQGTLIAKAA